MAWYDDTLAHLNKGQTYSYQYLITDLRNRHPELKTSSHNWAINGMLKSGELVRTGYDKYRIANEDILPEYEPSYSAFSGNLMQEISGRYPSFMFTVFETFLLNEFLTHTFDNNTVFIMTEKNAGVYLLRYLQNLGHSHLLLKPSPREFYLYWHKDCIVINDQISEAIVNHRDARRICLERMLVDIAADPNIRRVYDASEYPLVVQNAVLHYRIDRTRMLRYARRRNKYEMIMQLLAAVDEENSFSTK